MAINVLFDRNSSVRKHRSQHLDRPCENPQAVGQYAATGYGSDQHAVMFRVTFSRLDKTICTQAMG